MPLVVAQPLLSLASARTLERLGLGQRALQSLPLAQRLEALRAATGELAPYLRKRYALPLVPTLDVETVDVSGLPGATVAWDGGPATRVDDYLITFTVANGATSYTLTTSAGAYGATAGPSAPWLGSLTVDGYTVTLSGTIANGNTLAWSTAIVQDPGVAFAVVRIAACALLYSRGLDPKTLVDLVEQRDAALTWARALGIPGEGELAPTADATPTVSEYGPLVSGNSSPYAFLDQP